MIGTYLPTLGSQVDRVNLGSSSVTLSVFETFVKDSDAKSQKKKKEKRANGPDS